MLDNKKATELYAIIASTQEMFSDNENNYYKIFVTLERLESTVKILNQITLSGTWNEEAVEFVLWVNYADLLVACIKNIALAYSVDIKNSWNIFEKYHGIESKTDYDFFRFIRAIILPHALSVNEKYQMAFTNNKTAFCSRVVWDIDGKVRIVYYNADIKNDLHTYNIAIADCIEFVERYYQLIDELIKVIPIRKNKCKNTMKQKLLKEPYDVNASIKEKCRFLKELTMKYGDLDDKAEVSYTMLILNRCEKMLLHKYRGKNSFIFDKYKKALNMALDEYYVYMCEGRTDEKLLDLVLSPRIRHSSSETKIFSGKEYFINKIINECENFDCFFERYDFLEFFEELKDCLKRYASVKRNMKMMHFCYLAIMVAFVAKVEDTDEYKNAFSSIK